MEHLINNVMKRKMHNQRLFARQMYNPFANGHIRAINAINAHLNRTLQIHLHSKG